MSEETNNKRSTKRPVNHGDDADRSERRNLEERRRVRPNEDVRRRERPSEDARRRERPSEDARRRERPSQDARRRERSSDGVREKVPRNARGTEPDTIDVDTMLSGVHVDEEQYIRRREQRKAARLKEQRRKKRALMVVAAMLIVGVLAIGLIVTGIVVLFQEDPFEEATVLLQEYDYLGAIEWYELAIEEENNVAASYRAIGLAYWELGMYDEAETALLTSIAQGAEETSIVYNMLLTLEMEEENYTQALAYIELILTLEDLIDSMKQEILKYEIVCYEAVYDWDTVTEKLQTYVSLYPDDAEMANELEFFETR